MQEVIKKLNLPYASGELQGKIKIHTDTNTPLIEISARDTNPLIAQQIADTTIQVYIEQYREKLQANTEASLSEIQNEINQTSSRINTLTVKKNTAKLSSEEEDELVTLQNDLEQLKSLRTMWNFELSQAMAAAGISMGETASLPTSPVSPKTMQNVILASILGLVVTTGGVFFKEYLDRSIKTPEDISKVTGLPILGVISQYSAKSRKAIELVTETQPQGTIAEAFRMLHTNLRFATLDKPAKTIIVTSPGPNEGKSSVLANLAISIAQMGNTVIAVDTDLRHHKLNTLFDVHNDAGFTDLLLSEQFDIDKFLQPTKIKELKILSRGSHSYNPAQLLGSPKASFLIEALKKEADLVLFDSPPILAVADTSILAPKVDAAILVVKAGHTRIEALVDAKEVLSKGNVIILGVVLNQVEVSGRGGYYYRYRYPNYKYTDDGGEKKRDKHILSSGKSKLQRFFKRIQKFLAFPA
jgi:non-specific protein-tyrosine kinase